MLYQLSHSPPGLGSIASSVRPDHEHVFVSFEPPDAWSYAYLLGMYLGDGHLGGTKRCPQLRVALDAAYPAVVEETAIAMKLVHTEGNVRLRMPPSRSWRLECAWRRWPEVFPQHGAGRKHERPIVLEPWQRQIVTAHPRPFLRALVHSDGARCVNRFSTTLPSGRKAEYAYPRYFFSNLSADIRGLFCEACDQLGVRWTQSNHRNISIAHRRSVAVLDEFIGPKA